MPTSVPVPTRSPGDLLTSALWNAQVRDNINKLLDRGHRVLTVAQFAALTGLEDGDEVYLEVDSSNGIQWHLRYVAAEPTYKWRFLGGPPLQSEVATGEGTASAAYVDLATVLSVTLPRGGDYDISHGFGGSNSTGGFNYIGSVKLGAAATSDNEFALGSATGAAQATTHARALRRAGLAAAAVLKQQYKTNGGTATFSGRFLRVSPTRII